MCSSCDAPTDYAATHQSDAVADTPWTIFPPPAPVSAPVAEARVELPVEKPRKRAHNFQDLTDQVFGRLRVLRLSGERKKDRQARWVCLCDCGEETTVSASALKKGQQSCRACRVLSGHPILDTPIPDCPEGGGYTYELLNADGVVIRAGKTRGGYNKVGNHVARVRMRDYYRGAAWINEVASIRWSVYATVPEMDDAEPKVIQLHQPIYNERLKVDRSPKYKLVKTFYSLDEVVIQPEPTNPNFKSLRGGVFGRLTVLGFKGINRHNKAEWFCLCACGRITTMATGTLRSGLTKSCGCLLVEASTARRTTHGLTTSLPRLFSAWGGLLTRCNSRRYRERGITVHPDWQTFEGFAASWNFTEPAAGLTLDRIDGTKSYARDNCRWATPQQQSENLATNHNILVDGLSRYLPTTSGAGLVGVSASALRDRINRGKLPRLQGGLIYRQRLTNGYRINKAIELLDDTEALGFWLMNLKRENYKYDRRDHRYSGSRKMAANMSVPLSRESVNPAYLRFIAERHPIARMAQKLRERNIQLAA